MDERESVMEAQQQHMHHNPVTGDPLPFGEYVSWLVQGVIRKWSFLIVILVITALCWATNNEKILLWWNLSASLLAIVIEAIVGKGMFGQTVRDAVILRHLEKLEEQDLKSDLTSGETLREITNELHQRLDLLEDMVEENTELTRIRRRGRLSLVPSSSEEETEPEKDTEDKPYNGPMYTA